MHNIEEQMKQFYCGKRVLVTGHTGFKGTWLCSVLDYLGATVIGYALEPPTNPSLFEITDMEHRMRSYIGDIRDIRMLDKVFEEEKPEIVIHMAAQPIVRVSYEKPVETYEVNVMGTVNLLECIRKTKTVKSVINVTTDKVYRNKEQEVGFVEGDELNGFDPYSNSKSCSELVTDCYRNSFFSCDEIAVSTMRAGNVIGGGDFAKDRIVPDCVRAALEQKDIFVRNPFSIRPYQHVLEPIVAYLFVAMEQYKDKRKAGAYNIGPNREDCVETGKIVASFCKAWKKLSGNETNWVHKNQDGPHEAGILMLDCTKMKQQMGWYPRWNIETAIEKTVQLSLKLMNEKDVVQCIKEQISIFFES